MRILIIENEVKLGQSLKKVLVSQGYAVDIETNGESGYARGATEDYDLILLDVGLPRMDGLAVCRHLRADRIIVPILMLTARDTLADKVTGLDQGADDYLVKPFDVEELLARMRSLLRRGRPNPAVILEAGSLQLDVATRIACRCGQEIALSAKELALLEFMLRHPNHILSKQQLLDHVWDGEVDPFSNVVDVYIGYLRQKVDRPFPGEKTLLVTVKGLGYRLEV
jgi:DNA-binding response OmpR family regulator